MERVNFHICDFYMKRKCLFLRYFRFYGRIATEPDAHDEPTIEAIKQNINGLERISGERIWSELQKILEGNYARELMEKILECGMGKYIGLPEKPNVEMFNEVFLRAQENKINLMPCTALSALLKNEDEALALHSRLKLSAFNRDLLLFLVEYKNKLISTNSIKPYQYILLHEKGKLEAKKEFILQLLKYRGEIETYQKFNSWFLPRFPISGNMIKEHVNNPKMIGVVVKKLKDVWFENDFKLSKDELIELIPNIVEESENGNVKMDVRNK